MIAPRVMIVTLSFGSGHARAAAAVAAEISRESPAADVRIIDALATAQPLFRALYVRPYWLMLRYAPSLWRRLFESRLRHLSRHTAPEWLFQLGCRATFRAVERFEPDVIVAGEVAANEMAGIVLRAGRTRARVVALITDRQAEPAWVRKTVDAYVVPDASVATQLEDWGAPAERIIVRGIPIDSSFTQSMTGARTRDGDGRPLVLVMGGGMGPTRMDVVVRALMSHDVPMRIVAVAGRDGRALQRLQRITSTARVMLDVRGWVDDVASLMRQASVIVTKPGGVTTAEAAACGVPMVLFNAIPGPEEINARWIAASGAGVMTAGGTSTATAVVDLLSRPKALVAMGAAASALAAPGASRAVAALVLQTAQLADPSADVRPFLFLTINNGAGHTQVAAAIAGALAREGGPVASIVDVAQYMSWPARFTHVTAYLWLLRHLPALWARIDQYQKRQSTTSPEWYYRRHARRLFEAVRRMRPGAIVATEVGCCEIATLIVRDLGLTCPVVAVNGEYDADRAWVRPEVSAYAVANETVADELLRHGAPRERVHVWGVPLGGAFAQTVDQRHAKSVVCARLGLEPSLPLVLLSGGGEGLGQPHAVLSRLLQLEAPSVNVIVLAARSEATRRRCEAIATRRAPDRVRVLGWTDAVRELMGAADLLVSKLGHTFDEGVAACIPIVSLPPPPGSEVVQYRLLREWGVGCAVNDLDDLAHTVHRLLTHDAERQAMRDAARARRHVRAAERVAQWITRAIERSASVAIRDEDSNRAAFVPVEIDR